MKISIRKSTRKPQINIAPLREAIEQTLRGENREDAEVSVLLVNDERMRDLNRTYRGVDSSTDVLAFPMGEGEFAGLNPHMLGDVVVSVERALLQAKQAGHDLIDEMRLLAVHGTLHLLGYEDETSAGRTRMRRLAKKYIMNKGSRR